MPMSRRRLRLSTHAEATARQPHRSSGIGRPHLQQMVADTDEAILVTSFLGGNSNATTGDFSLGIKGFYIKDGVIQHPISEMNVAGNHLKFWKKLVEVGNDPWTYSSNRTPTLRFADIQCSGM